MFRRNMITSASTVENGKQRTIAQAGAQPINMDNGVGQPLAETSALAANGSTFTVARTDVPVQAFAPGGRRFLGRGNRP